MSDKLEYEPSFEGQLQQANDEIVRLDAALAASQAELAALKLAMDCPLVLSCLCCGQLIQGEDIAVQWRESEIVVCLTCRDAKAKLAAMEQGRCLKCNMGPLRESCAYPEACQHPGRELAYKLNQSLLDVTAQRARADALEQKLAALEQERDEAKRNSLICGAPNCGPMARRGEAGLGKAWLGGARQG